MSKQEGRARHWQSWLGILLSVLLLPLLVVNLTLIAKSFLSPERVPDFLGYKPFVVLSGSMRPTILEGDLIITREVAPATLKAGDIIAYRLGESVITHRVDSLESGDGQTRLITRGDANNALDQRPVDLSQVEGLYLWRVPGLGHVALFLQTPIGLVLVILGPLALFFLYDTLRRRRQSGQAQQRADALAAELEQLRGQLGQKTEDSHESK